MLGIVCLSKATKYRTQKTLCIIRQLFINQFFKNLREQWKYTNRAVVLFIKRIILFKNWSDISFFQAVRKCSIFKRFIYAIGQYRKCKITFFQDICWYIPADRFVTLKVFDNLLYIIYRNRLKRKFTSNIKILFDCFDARMVNKLN